MATQTMAQSTRTTAKSRTRPPSSARNNRKTARVGTTAIPNADRVRSWLRLSRDELDDLYRKADSGAMPQGDTRGTPIFAGWPMPGWLAGLARTLGWQGKVFDLQGKARDAGVVVNKVTPLGLNLIVAKVYRGESWLDGRDTIVIDYSGTSLVARSVRDEIREVAPGLYLGKVWLGRRRVLDFALELPDSTES
ncbi:hypothetical protein [Marinobacter sp. OP 3.4]|uniref:hypothetical protein n=1 Tax=Marinobacter sp. OP 3.4 TaxID=3076501 RepID=UPI002E1E976D